MRDAEIKPEKLLTKRNHEASKTNKLLTKQSQISVKRNGVSSRKNQPHHTYKIEKSQKLTALFVRFYDSDSFFMCFLTRESNSRLN